MSECTLEFVDKEHTKLICICSMNTNNSMDDQGIASVLQAIHGIIKNNNLLLEDNTLYLVPKSKLKELRNSTYIKFNGITYSSSVTNTFLKTYNDSLPQGYVVKDIITQVRSFVAEDDLVHLYFVDHGSETGLGHDNFFSYEDFFNFLNELPVKVLRIYNDCCYSGVLVSAFSVYEKLSALAEKLSESFSKKIIEFFLGNLINNNQIFDLGLNSQEIVEASESLSQIISSQKLEQLSQNLRTSKSVPFLILGIHNLRLFIKTNQQLVFGCQTIEDIQNKIQIILSYISDINIRPFVSMNEFECALEELKNFGIQKINEVILLDYYFQTPQFQQTDNYFKIKILEEFARPEFSKLFKAFTTLEEPMLFENQISVLSKADIRFHFRKNQNADIKVISCCDASEIGYFHDMINTPDGYKQNPGTIGAEIFIKEMFVESKDGVISIERIRNSIPKGISMRPLCYESSTCKTKDSFTLLFDSPEKVPKSVEELMLLSGFEKVVFRVSEPSEQPVKKARKRGGSALSSSGYFSEISVIFEEEEEEADAKEKESSNDPRVDLMEEMFRLYDIRLQKLEMHFDAHTYPFTDSTYTNKKLRQAIDKMNEIHHTRNIYCVLLPYLSRLVDFLNHAEYQYPELYRALPECYKEALEKMQAKGYVIE